MKKARLIVMNNIYRGDTAIENVLNYVVSSPFADLDEMLVNNLRTDTFENMVQDFYKVQEPYPIEKHRRLFHFALSTRGAKNMERTVDEAAYALLDYFTDLGHQVLLVPHIASKNNMYNYHWHVVVNVKSYSTGLTLLDKYSTYNAIIHYLNQNPHTHWSWSYHNNERIKPQEYL